MNDENNKLPLGFAMALAQNPEAMNKFAALSQAQKQEYINRAKNVSSKSEMQQLVSVLAGSNSFKM